MAKDQKNRSLGASKLDTIPISTILGGDILYRGDISGDNVIRIDGRVEGNIFSKQGVILGEGAHIEGSIESESIIIFGHITGSIKSKELILKSSGSIQGDIVSDFLEVEMGSKFNGNLKIGPSSETKQPPTPDTIK